MPVKKLIRDKNNLKFKAPVLDRCLRFTCASVSFQKFSNRRSLLLQISKWNWFRLNPYISGSFRSVTNEREIGFRRADSFGMKIRMTPTNKDSSFSIRIDVSSSFRMIPHRWEQSSHSVWIHLMNSPFSPNDSMAHLNELDSKWFGNRFCIQTVLHGIIFIPNKSETFTRENTLEFVNNLRKMNGFILLFYHVKITLSLVRLTPSFALFMKMHRICCFFK